MLLNVAYSLFCDWGNWKRRLVLWKYYRGSICICESKFLPGRMKSTGIFDIWKQLWFHGSVLGASSMLCTLSLMGKAGTAACLPAPAPCPVRPFRKGSVASAWPPQHNWGRGKSWKLILYLFCFLLSSPTSHFLSSLEWKFDVLFSLFSKWWVSKLTKTC